MVERRLYLNSAHTTTRITVKVRTVLLTVIITAFVGSRSYCQTRQALTGMLQPSKQPTVKYDVFSRPSLGQIPITLPQPAQFEPVSSRVSPGMNLQTQTNSILNNQHFIEQQNQQVLRQHNQLANATNSRQVQQLAEIERDLMQEKFYREHREWLNKTAGYRDAYSQLLQLNPDSFSITKAVFIIENAWYGNKYTLEQFRTRLQLEAKIIRQQLKNEKLDVKDNLALNYGIQKRFKQSIYYYDPRKKKTITIKPFGYDFEDFQGEKDYAKMFVTKMMIKGNGQCHSMPLMYLMLAEQLGAKAWLSLAPQHSFVQFADRSNNLMNFETTNGNLVSSNWLLQSGFINANALKEKTYLDTLSQKQLFAQCLSDLLLGYLNKFNYDDFAEQMRQQIAAIDPGNTTTLLIDANIKTQIAAQKINEAGRPKEKDLPQFPEAYQAYLDMMVAYEKVDGKGYQDMPKEAYQKWLKTIEQEKKKQENLQLKEKMQKGIQFMKKRKSIVVDRTKD